MRYWFTTHWPAREDEPADRTPYGVWAPDDKLAVIKDLSQGDLVWIYEAKSGPIEEREEEGVTRRVRCRRGRMGVIGLVVATEPPQEAAGSRAEQYVGRTGIWWRYHAATRPFNTAGFIPMSEAVLLLGHKPAFNFHGYGGGSGLKEIGLAAHERLLKAFLASSDADLATRLARPLPPGGFRPGGEGAPHLALKKRIAADPAGVLGEPGLCHVATELKYPTGDKIDVVLKDRYGRLVAVEVEVDCGAEEVCGPFQCMKYRGLLAYRFDRDLLEVRMLLAAHSVHPAVQEKCKRFEIEVVEVSRT